MESEVVALYERREKMLWRAFNYQHEYLEVSERTKSQLRDDKAMKDRQEAKIVKEQNRIMQQIQRRSNKTTDSSNTVNSNQESGKSKSSKTEPIVISKSKLVDSEEEIEQASSFNEQMKSECSANEMLYREDQVNDHKYSPHPPKNDLLFAQPYF